jgi:pyruvate,water dikinase
LQELLDYDWDPTAYWSRANAGEAMPGVLTPLTWSFWGPAAERASRRAFVAIGALESSGAALPDDPAERILATFHGRVAAKVTWVGKMGDRLPGTSGAAVAEQVLGSLPEDFVSRPTARRLPVIAGRFPLAAMTTPRRVRATATATDAWWAEQSRRADALSLPAARAQWREASVRFEHVMTLQVLGVFAVVQPLYELLARLAARAGDPGLAGRLMAGQGSHAEMAVVADIWRVSRGELSIEALLAVHGFHGPLEGELSSRVWREDPAPLIATVERYRQKDDGESPDQLALQRAAERAQAERQLLAGLPQPWRRPARAALTLVARNVPLRGVGKRAFLQTIDVARMAARRVGELLAETGTLPAPDDVFLLTGKELLQAPPGESLAERVAERGAERARYLRVDLPKAWKGRPQTFVRGAREQGSGTLSGLGASPGTVEGTVRVLLEPDFEAVQPDEILVAPTTDPSWAPVMFTASALVVDIGGALSHAAIVAREMGIPCVMNTGNGTTQLRTGDRCRVDGAAGIVELLEPVAEPERQSNQSDTEETWTLHR